MYIMVCHVSSIWKEKINEFESIIKVLYNMSHRWEKAISEDWNDKLAHILEGKFPLKIQFGKIHYHRPIFIVARPEDCLGWSLSYTVDRIGSSSIITRPSYILHVHNTITVDACMHGHSPKIYVSLLYPSPFVTIGQPGKKTIIIFLKETVKGYWW